MSTEYFITMLFKIALSCVIIIPFLIAIFNSVGRLFDHGYNQISNLIAEKRKLHPAAKTKCLTFIRVMNSPHLKRLLAYIFLFGLGLSIVFIVIITLGGWPTFDTSRYIFPFIDNRSSPETYFSIIFIVGGFFGFLIWYLKEPPNREPPEKDNHGK